MPATSRSGESNGRRSADRADRLALEVEQHPAVDGAQRLAEVQVAVDALDRRAGTSSTRELVERARSPASTVGELRRRPRAPRRGGRASPPPRSRSCAGVSSSVPNAVGQVGVHLGDAAPSRWASPAKSPPASSACRSASAIRSRTLVLASSQPSVAVVMNSCSIARLARLRRRRSAVDRSRAAGRCAWRPASVERRRAISMSGLTPGSAAGTPSGSPASPKISEVLDCSPVSTRLVLVRPGARSASTKRSKRSGAVGALGRGSPTSQAWVTSLSCSAS